MNEQLNVTQNPDVLQPPLFSEVLTKREQYGVELLVQSGLAPNQFGQVFVVEVASQQPEPIKRYVSEVRMDFAFALGDRRPDPSEDTVPGEVEEGRSVGNADEYTMQLLRNSPEAVVISIEPIGICRSWDFVQGREIIASWISEPYSTWRARLEQELAFISIAQALKEEIGEVSSPYSLAFAIDPPVSDGNPNDYKKKCVKSAKVILEISGGTGAVRATVLKNGVERTPHLSAPATNNEPSSRTFSSNNTKPFDLEVTENSRRITSVYKVSGTWFCDYLQAAPAGGECAPAS